MISNCDRFSGGKRIGGSRKVYQKVLTQARSIVEVLSEDWRSNCHLKVTGRQEWGEECGGPEEEEAW